MLKFKRHMEVAKQREIKNKAYGVEMNTNCEISYKHHKGKTEQCKIDGDILEVVEGVTQIIETIALSGGFREKEMYEYLLQEQIKKDKKRINIKRVGGNNHDKI